MIPVSLSTKFEIGYKFELTVNNGIKIIAAKNRQIFIAVEDDLYNIHAFTLKGTKAVNEVRIRGVFGGRQLQQAIIKAANNT